MGRPMIKGSRGGGPRAAASVALFLCIPVILITFFFTIRWTLTSVNAIAKQVDIVNPVNANVMPTANDIEDKINHKTFLYNRATNVVELHNEDIKSFVLESTTLSIVVFYAPWCAHCQRYVPIYNKIADKYKANEGVKFYAVNCVEYHEACDREKLKGYPTVIAFNIKGKEGNVKEKSITSREADIIEFVDDHSKVDGSDKPGDLSDGTASASLATYTDWLQATKNGAARECGAVSRLQDALASLDYFITKDLRVRFDDRKKEAALALLAVVAKVLPDAVQRAGYAAAHQWLASRSAQEAGKGWQAELSPLLAKRRDGAPIAWLVCGKEQASTVAMLDSTKAFNCGMWLLLHYLTVAAEEMHIKANNNKSKSNAVSVVTASDVLAVVHSFVADLFGCLECRTNFLARYDACDFGRCAITEHDYPKLQLWLFHMHNAATIKISNELAKAVPPAYLDSQLAAMPPAETQWPSSGGCSACLKGGASGGDAPLRDRVYNFLSFDERAVLEHLVRAYRVK